MTALGGLAGAVRAGLRGDACPTTAASPRWSTSRKDIKRFCAAFVTWVGGSNYTDDPRRAVERRRGARLGAVRRPVGRGADDRQVPAARGGAGATRLGAQKWQWTAHFEAFASDVPRPGRAARRPRPRAPTASWSRAAGGEGRKVVAYPLSSQPFDVRRGTASPSPDIRADDAGVSFAVGPTSTYRLPAQAPVGGSRPIEQKVEGAGTGRRRRDGRPDRLPGHLQVAGAKFIKPDAHRRARPGRAGRRRRGSSGTASTASFRPWADTGEPECAAVTIVGATGARGGARASETRRPLGCAGCRCAAASWRSCSRAECATRFGQINAKASDTVGNGTAAARRTAARLADATTTCG